MYSILEFHGRSVPRTKKFLHSFPVVSLAGLKALAIMKDEAWIVIRGVCIFHIGSPGTTMCDIDALMCSASAVVENGTSAKFTVKLMLKMLLMSDDFPTPLYAAVNSKP